MGYFDNAWNGWKTKQILDDIVFSFFQDKLEIKWHNTDLGFLCHVIQCEFCMGTEMVHDDYKTTLVIDDLKFNEFNYNLLNLLLTKKSGECTFYIENNMGLLRSQIMVLKVDPLNDNSHIYIVDEMNSHKI